MSPYAEDFAGFAVQAVLKQRHCLTCGTMLNDARRGDPCVMGCELTRCELCHTPLYAETRSVCVERETCDSCETSEPCRSCADDIRDDKGL